MRTEGVNKRPQIFSVKSKVRRDLNSKFYFDEEKLLRRCIFIHINNCSVVRKFKNVSLKY